MTVHFIGAGPGAADLITVRGRELIARCPVCLYAGSIVPRELLEHCPGDARIVDTAPLTLDEIEAEYVNAHAAGRDVARLHSGDLSIYSALAEQLRRAHRAVLPGYHLNKRHWNTVVIDGSLPDEMIKDMIEDSYDLVVSKLPRARRRALGWRGEPG